MSNIFPSLDWKGITFTHYSDIVVYSLEFPKTVQKGAEIDLTVRSNWASKSVPFPAELPQGKVEQFYKFNGNLYWNSPYESFVVTHTVKYFPTYPVYNQKLRQRIIRLHSHQSNCLANQSFMAPTKMFQSTPLNHF